MRAEEFPVDLLMLNLEDYDIMQEKHGQLGKHQTLPPLVLTSSLMNLPDDELLMPLSPFHDCEMPLSPASPSLYSACTTPISTPAESRCTTPNWSTPCSKRSSVVSTPSSTNSFSSTPSQSHHGSPHSTGFPSPQPASTATATTTNCDTKPLKIPRHKRKSHIRAEHKRRNKIQNGYEVVKALVPSLAESPTGSKDTKSVVLKKTADYCRQLQGETKDLSKETEELQAEIRALTAEISQFQERLPVNGVDMNAPSSGLPIEKMFDDYVRARIFQNWKFWIFSMIARPLFQSFNRMVQTSTFSSFTSSIMSWFEQHCSLVSLRPVLLNMLRKLSTDTSIINAPEQLPEEALQAALSEPTIQDGKPQYAL